MSELTDLAVERAVLASVCAHGADAFADAAGLITSKTMTDHTHQALWACLSRIVADDPNAKVDFPSVLSAASALGVSGAFSKPEDLGVVRAVFNMPVRLESTRKLAAKLRKLEFARDALVVLDGVRDSVRNMTGDETAESMVAQIETPVLDISAMLSSGGGGPRAVGEGLREYAAYLAANQRAVVGVRSNYRLYDKSIGGGFRPGTVNVIGARPKQGKAQPLDSTVHTPTGPKRMGDIRIGDAVCTPTGTSVVEAIHPQGEIDVYRVVFSDGDFVECCADHLWEVKGRRRKSKEVVSLREIMSDMQEGDGRPKWSVRLPTACHREFQPVPMDPYMLGVVIGDGSLMNKSVSLTSADQELIDGVSVHLTEGYSWNKCKSKYGYTLSRGRTGGKVNKYKQVFRDLGLDGKTSHHKFIPEVYKLNSEGVRLAVIQGLMDTDGHADESGNVEYSTTSIRLASDVKDIVQSLGGLCSITPRTTTCNGKSFPSFRLHVRMNDPDTLFRLSRKRARCHVRKKPSLKRTIAEVKLVGRKECQCITIANPNGLYLTDNYVVTHNSLLATNIGIMVSGGVEYGAKTVHPAPALGVPVLQLDTEMTREDQWNRQMACMSGVNIDDVETGLYGNDPRKCELVSKAIDAFERLPYDFLSIAGQPFEETEATMRRWVTRRVGLNPDGSAKPCLVIFDYLKLMDSSSMESKNLAEFQVLGFMMTRLHNFAVKFKVPVLTFVQLNRDGIDTEDSSAVSGSDRIVWLCSNFSIYKTKGPEEIAEQAGQSGPRWNRKLVPVVARHGAGLEAGDYVNMMSYGATARVIEGPTRNGGGRSDGPIHPRGVVLGDTADQADVPFAA